jgi:hypothetical protein
VLVFLFSSVIYRGALAAPERAALSWESPEPLMLKQSPQSPLLARKESFGREMVDLILPYLFDFHVIVRGF